MLGCLQLFMYIRKYMKYNWHAEFSVSETSAKPNETFYGKCF